MTHQGKAALAARALVQKSAALLVVAAVAAVASRWVGSWLLVPAAVAAGLWKLFVLFTLYFFRDPDPRPPSDPKAIVAPAHGTVDVVDETKEKEFLGGPCWRVSIFLSVFDVHVQNAPVAGRVVCLKHTPGQFLNAMRADSAAYNENLLIGFESDEAPGERVSVRLIAGLIARRIVPWVRVGERVARGERLSLIQFGSRVDCYLPLTTRVVVTPGQRVRGGQTILATRV